MLVPYQALDGLKKKLTGDDDKDKKTKDKIEKKEGTKKASAPLPPLRARARAARHGAEAGRETKKVESLLQCAAPRCAARHGPHVVLLRCRTAPVVPADRGRGMPFFGGRRYIVGASL